MKAVTTSDSIPTQTVNQVRFVRLQSSLRHSKVGYAHYQCRPIRPDALLIFLIRRPATRVAHVLAKHFLHHAQILHAA